MATNPNWPLTTSQVAFNAGPNDPAAVPSWSDLSIRMEQFGAARGRQYELDVVEAGEGSVVYDDEDELLNPANTTSPYFPNVVPYRQIVKQAMWPPVPVGSAVNLLNANAQGVVYDPSFESYTAGAAVSWLTAIGAVTPVVGTTTPHAGSNDVTWTVANGTTVQGVQWPAPCIPGQQYTSSAYVRQSSASTQVLTVTDQNLALDAFNRTSASSWGTADLGGAWTNTGGSAGDYNVAAGVASHSNAAVNTPHLSTVGSSIADSDIRVAVTVPAVAVGDEIDIGVMSRFIDASNYYMAEVVFFANLTVGVRIQRRVAGTTTSITSALLPGTYAAGTKVWLRFQTTGPQLQAKAWKDGQPPPIAWSVTATDTNLTTAGAVGCRSKLGPSLTNSLPLVCTFAAFAATGSVVGTSTSTTGAYVRLTVTWVATQPGHTVQLATTGTAVAGTVLLDDIQHEVGASASAAITTGPVIYGVQRGFVERWPSSWQFQGTFGLAQITTVDAFAALAGQDMHTAYGAALALTGPDYQWSLAESAQSTTFAEVSGNGGPALAFYSSKYGQGTLPEPGQQINVPGDPAVTGVKFTPPGGDQSLNTHPATVLGVGPTVPGTYSTVLLPASIGTTWALSAACWANITGTLALNPQIGVLVSNIKVPSQSEVDPLLAALDNTNLTYEAFTPTTGADVFTAPATPPQYGVPHLFVGVVTQDATNTVLTWYIDGVQVGTATFSTSGIFINGMLPMQATDVIVGGGANDASLISLVNGVMSRVAIWNRALTSAEVTALWTAGEGFQGEGSGARITRYLTNTGYVGPYAIDTGLSLMDIDTVEENTALLDACLNVALTENGVFWADGRGVLQFAARSRRYLNRTSKWVFGENQAGGEYPYEGDIAYDYDPTQIFNAIEVDRVRGVKATVTDVASKRAYFPRSYQRTINPSTDAEAVDAANFLLATHKAPQQRIASLTIKPSSNPALWPVALGAELGDRVTVKRRTSAGVTMSGDFFIERIEHSQKAGEWTVAFQMSPVAWAPTPWLLDDATFSVLGSTTVLSY